MIREIRTEKIIQAVRDLCIEANTDIGEDLLKAYEEGMNAEESPIGKEIFQQMLENARVAREKKLALCQDTGLVVVFADMGQDVHVTGGDFYAAIHEGVRRGYLEGYFRSSVVEPITRKVSGDNSPAIIHVTIVPGSRLLLNVIPKGFGGENFSKVVLFPPSVGMSGVMDFIIETIRNAGSSPCPPIIVGVGIGGTMEKAAIMAKRTLFRPLGSSHPDPVVAGLERTLLDEINKLGIGPQGLGGKVTALDVHIETFPTHIASIPVAVNIQCNSHRHKEVIL
ncbi:MAG: fumarate hydratase [Syntrophales bacterium]|jgi:fumarate hydratase subunit alpha|nr:fumarate hydratase [Syntrophales bacterium]